MQLHNLLLSIIYPKRCLRCKKVGRYFCTTCTDQIQSSIMPSICPICTKQAVGGATHPFCQTRYNLNGFVGMFRYSQTLRRAIQKIKFQRSFALSDEIAQIVYQTLTENRANQYSSFLHYIKLYKPHIIPIPLHWRRKRKRWFNQSEIFGKSLAKLFNLEIDSSLLIRTKYTTPQVHLSRKERLVNIRGVFDINPNYQLPFTNYLIIDDVWTTGATLREAGSVLKRAGAKNVWGLTIAR